jgi:hypothetical protein
MELAVNEAFGGIFTNHIVRKDLGLCPICGDPPGEFRDEISKREFKISGMCQGCQNSLFNESEYMS